MLEAKAITAAKPQSPAPPAVPPLLVVAVLLLLLLLLLLLSSALGVKPLLRSAVQPVLRCPPVTLLPLLLLLLVSSSFVLLMSTRGGALPLCPPLSAGCLRTGNTCCRAATPACNILSSD
jgi:hypothetical protein